MDHEPSGRSKFDVERILAEGAWVRGLALSLVRDGDLAEDLVQETWLAALRHPPPGGGRLRPWLARVVLNLARQHRRSEANRAVRELRAARHEVVPPASSSAQRLEVQQLLLDALREIPDQFRSVVIDHYFDGLPSAAIARRNGVPASTIRWKLQRGLEELRAQLDRRMGGNRGQWSFALLPLLPAPFIRQAVAWKAAAIGKKAIFMGAGTKAGIAAAVVAVTAMVVWVESRPEPEHPGLHEDSPVATGKVEVSAQAGSPEHEDLVSPSQGQRSPERAEHPEDSTQPQHPVTDDRKKRAPEGTKLQLGFVDSTNRSVKPRDAWIKMSRSGEVDIERETHGAAAAEILGLSEGHYTISVRASEYDDGQATVDIPKSAASIETRVCLTSGRTLSIIVADAEGHSMREWAKEWGGEPKHFFHGCFQARLSEAATNDEMGGTPVRMESVAKMQGQDCIPPGCVGTIARVDGMNCWIGLEYLGSPLGWEHASPADRQVRFIVDSSKLMERLAKVRLRVLRSENLAPALSATVVLLSDSSTHRRPEQVAERHPDAEGYITFANLVPEDYELRVQLREHELLSEATRRLDLAAGSDTDLGEILVSGEPPISIRVVDAAGRDVDQAYVQFGPFVQGMEEENVYSTHGQPRQWDKGPDGRFQIPRPSQDVVIRAIKKDSDLFYQENPQASRSANLLLHFPVGVSSEPVLVVQDPQPVQITFDLTVASGSAEIVDALGLVVVRRLIKNTDPWTLKLIPGGYRLHWNADGSQAQSKSLIVGAEPVMVHVP